MGDMADWLNEQGMDALDEHNRGDCDGWCPYCHQKPARKPRRKPKAAAKRAPKKEKNS
jgi:hypothetical protein